MSDKQNMILAMVLSAIVLLGWQYFVIGPQIEEERQRQEAIQAQQQAQGEGETGPGTQVPGAAAPGSPSAGAVPQSGVRQAQPVSRDSVVAASSRVDIRTERMAGSINLTGARIDDLRLLSYQETSDPDSPTVLLLSPSATQNPYYAEFGWVAESGAEVALPGPQTVWTAETGGSLAVDQPVTLAWDNGAGLIFRRTISVDAGYMFTVTQSVENTGGDAVTLYPFGLISRHGQPQTTNFFILHEGLIGVFGEDGLQEVDYEDLIEAKTMPYAQVPSGWLGITDKYWATALIPPADRPFTPRYTSGSIVSKPTFQADYLSTAVVVAGGTTADVTTRLFAGAKQVELIDDYEAQLGIDRFELLIDWGWFYFITKPLFYLIDYLYGILGNFGLAILAVTVLIKLAFFPLANKSYKSMTMMKKVQPEVMEIRDKYADDKQKQQQMMMELYKKEKINPLSGCLPILVQIPVFFALYKVLFVTIDMRHAPFYGWIQDLSAPDPTTIFNLFGLIPWTPPDFLLLGVWPIIMGLTMFVQMKMNPAPTDATQALIFNWMPVLFTFMLASFPAGLVIYWAWNNALSILQQGIIMRRYGVKIELFDNIKGMFSKKQNKPAE
ncbi:MAG: membrane protein insertase YidC [Pseudomonadota bacterium]